MAKSHLTTALSLLCVALLSLPAADAHGRSYINRICLRAARRDPSISVPFCLTSLQAVPESYTTEVPGLLKITTDLALRNASSTTGVINKLATVACNDLTKQGLKTCLDAYTGAVAVLRDSAAAFAAQSYADGKGLQAAAAGAGQCEQALGTGLLKEENDNLSQLVTIASALHYFVTKHQRH